MKSKVSAIAPLNSVAIRCFFFMLLFVPFFSIHAQLGISYQIIPLKKDGLFKTEDRIGCDIKFKNNTYEKIVGVIKTYNKNKSGDYIPLKDFSFVVDSRKTSIANIRLEGIKYPPGFYELVMLLNADKYIDTLYFGYAVDLEKIYSNINKPNDFENFWDEAKRDLFNIDPKYNIIRRGDKSTKDVDVFMVEFQSLDNQKVKGWLSVPKEKGIYKVIYELPGYMEEINPDSSRSDLAVFRLIPRIPPNVKPDFNNYNTIGLNDKYKYIYRALYMDALRGLDFIFQNAQLKLDTKRVVIKGCGQGAILAAFVAAMDKRARACILERPLFVDMRNFFLSSEVKKSFPWTVKNFQAYMTYPRTRMTKENFFKIWDYFDPVNFVPNIQCKVLFAHSIRNTECPPECAIQMYNQLSIDNRDLYLSPEQNTMDEFYYVYQENWIKKI